MKEIKIADVIPTELHVRWESLQASIPTACQAGFHSTFATLTSTYVVHLHNHFITLALFLMPTAASVFIHAFVSSF